MILSKSGKAALACMAAALVFSGCAKTPHHEKEDVTAALAKLGEVKQYTFSGNAAIDWGTAPAAKDSSETSALLASLMALFSNSNWTWNGAVTTEPMRLEAEYKAAPGGGQQTLDFPMIVNQNVLYLSIPYLNKSGEYYSFDMSKWTSSDGAKAPLSLDGLKNTDAAVAQIMSLLLTDAKSGWFAKAKNPIDLADGKKGQSITMSITDKNRGEVSDQLNKELPAIADSLQKNGIMTAAQAEKLKSGGSQIALSGPGELSFIIDDAGYLRQMGLILDMTTKSASEAAAEAHHIEYKQEYDAINQPPTFTKEIPTNAKSFDEVLKQLPQK
ncbi:hypothetical protein [Gorillibacterium massiliense]|uniref:hypothetical protein n=1 Tax=Gorillibacterium massiliense TaxID=1280390 RepID=UPI0004B6B73C|nr:hypothetical protein [Gorillibacterium massiliense]